MPDSVGTRTFQASTCANIQKRDGLSRSLIRGGILSSVFLPPLKPESLLRSGNGSQPVKKSMTFLALAALGVVFGDIGTSPLYSFQTALWSIRGPDQSSVLGIASLIIWCLLLLVTVK